MVISVILSDGEPCDVRKLGLYELDVIPGPVTSGPFTYERIIGGGKVYEFEYDITKVTEPPQEPDVPELDAKEGSAAWWDWREYNLYHAALSYEKKRRDAVAEYLEKCAQYILDNCISSDDALRIITKEDWKKVYTVATVQELTRDLLAATLRSFRATYSNKEIFNAFDEAAPGEGTYDAIRVWEGQVMIKMGLTEAEYVLMPVEERARKVVANNMDKWMGYLDSDRQQKKIERERAAAEAKKGKR